MLPAVAAQARIAEADGLEARIAALEDRYGHD
jgi:BMFP domain-containing protein YqiC